MPKYRRKALVLEQLEPRQLLSGLSGNQIIGYVPNYEYGGGVNLSKMDWNALTQLNYFALIPTTAGAIPLPAGDQANITATVTAAHQHGVSVSVVFGGAGQDTALRQIINTSSTWNTFAANVLQLCMNNQLDGIDFDWEPGPGSSYPTATEIANYGNFLAAMNSAMPNLIISAAVNPETLPIGGDWNDRAYILNSAAVNNLDQIGVMAYDLEYNITSSIPHAEQDLSAWASYVGAASSKLIFGLPFYGTYGTDSINWSDTTPETYSDVINAYIAQTGHAPDTSVNSQSLSASFPGQFGGAVVPWSINSKGIIAKKTDDAVLANVGGVMIWELGQDHFTGGDYDTYSLLPIIKNTMDARSTIVAGGGQFLYDNRPMLKVHFATGLTASTLGPADLVLTNTTTHQAINTGTLATASYDAASKYASFTFNTSLLPDGNYTATLPAGSLRDGASQPLSVDYTFNSFVLGGDANHDRTINAIDLGILSHNWQGTSRIFSQGDFNYDGKVDILDLNILASHWQEILATPPPSALPASINMGTPSRTAVRMVTLVL